MSDKKSQPTLGNSHSFSQLLQETKSLLQVIRANSVQMITKA